MKTQIRRLFCPLSGLVVCLYSGNVASAQGTSNGSSSAQSGSSISQTIGRDKVVKDVLDNPRLRFRVTIERKATTIQQALAKLSEYTPLHLVAEGTGVRSTPIVFHYSATPLRDILAGIAETGYWEWTRKNENTLVLKERYNPHLLDAHRPRNEAQKEVYQRGAEFLGQLSKLPPDMQAALDYNSQVQNGASLPGLPFNSLPSAVQENLRAMFAAARASDDGNLPITSNNLSQSRVSLHTGTPQDGLDPFDVRLFAALPDGSNGGMSMSFVMFQDPRDGYNVVPLDQLTPIDSDSAAKDARSRQKALAANPRLQEKVSLKMENASFFQALKALSVKANIAFTAPYPPLKGKPAEKSFALPEMTLGEMLDKLTALYGGTDDQGHRYRYTWGQQGQQASQVFVFHISPDEKPAGE